MVCSFSEKETKFKAPKGFYMGGAELALCNYPTPTSDTLRPYECRVYLWK